MARTSMPEQETPTQRLGELDLAAGSTYRATHVHHPSPEARRTTRPSTGTGRERSRRSKLPTGFVINFWSPKSSL